MQHVSFNANVSEGKRTSHARTYHVKICCRDDCDVLLLLLKRSAATISVD